MLIKRKAVREFALGVAAKRTHQFTRVSPEFLVRCDAALKQFVHAEVRRLPSKGKTIA